MTTTELMIGNWVLDTRTNNPLQVNPFMAELEVPEWKEIELTRDILIKNEFSRTYCTQCFTYYDWYGHCIMVNLDNLNTTIKSCIMLHSINSFLFIFFKMQSK